MKSRATHLFTFGAFSYLVAQNSDLDHPTDPSVNGSISAFAAIGTYHVNPDCAGTYTVSDSAGNTFEAFFVIDQGGNELQIVITNPGTLINCVAPSLGSNFHWTSINRSDPAIPFDGVVAGSSKCDPALKLTGP